LLFVCVCTVKIKKCWKPPWLESVKISTD